MATKKCRLRADLIEQGLSINLNGQLLSDSRELEYNWLDDGSDYFEVFFGGEWIEAESIDFDFID